MNLRDYQDALMAKHPAVTGSMDLLRRLARVLRYVTVTAQHYGYSLEELASLDMEDSG